MTGYNSSTGVATYSYTLTSATTDVAAAVEEDVFTLTTSDGTVSSAPATITIEIVDDQPIAKDDANSVSEDSVLTATGNVLSNDVSGADTPKAFDSWTSALSGSYGTLVPGENGAYTYILNNQSTDVQGLDEGESLTETFTYQMKDADGDLSDATLTITINGANDGPEISTDSGNPEGANDVVYEAGLGDGSGIGETTTTVGGTFTLSDADGLDDIVSVTINGGSPIAIGDLIGSTISGAAGTFTVTGYNSSTGVATYSYTLTSATTDVAAAVEEDVFTLTTSDGTVSSAPATITIEIVDDQPIAKDDANSVSEDSVLTATGNVLSNDVSGADTPKAFDSWTSALSGSYGTLVPGENGAYTYILNNQSTDVQGLDEGESLTETFTYQMKDADGDLSDATLTITINGANDGPEISTDSGNPEGANDVVYEAGLGDGSGIGETTTTVGGTFTLSDADGLDDIVSVTINGGSPIAIGDLIGSTISGAAGTFTVTGYNSSTGVATYSYTLTSATTDVAAAVEEDVFTLTTSDGTVSSAPATITIEIVDDQPIAKDDANSVSEDSVLTATGNVLSNDVSGADTPKAFDSWTSALSGSYGTLVPGENGAYTYILNNQSTDVQGLDEGESLTETFTYQMKDADGDLSDATLTITINGANDGPEISTDSGNPEGANDVVYEAGLGDGSGIGETTTTVGGTFTLSDADGLDDIVSVTINGGSPIAIGDLIGSTISGAAGTFTVTGYNSSTGVATYSYTLTSATTDVAAAVEEDVFTLTTSDGTVSSAPATITIEIVDDQPIAKDDANSVSEDSVLTATGNVLSNDVSGADTPKAFDSWTSALSGSYGTLVPGENGAYTYILNNQSTDVQGLDEGESLTETFTYQMKDADGDLSDATLTITINGANDGPEISTDSGNPEGANDVVYEAGLGDGSGIGETTTTVGGTFTLSDADGLDDIVSVTINGGSPIAIGDLIGHDQRSGRHVHGDGVQQQHGSGDVQLHADQRDDGCGGRGGGRCLYADDLGWNGEFRPGDDHD